MLKEEAPLTRPALQLPRPTPIPEDLEGIEDDFLTDDDDEHHDAPCVPDSVYHDADED